MTDLVQYPDDAYFYNELQCPKGVDQEIKMHYISCCEFFGRVCLVVLSFSNGTTC